jgi:seryl-tRNA(Sec) selenium transferase
MMVRSESITAEGMASALRRNRPPVFPRVQNDAVLLDFRTVREPEDKVVVRALLSILKKG